MQITAIAKEIASTPHNLIGGSESRARMTPVEIKPTIARMMSPQLDVGSTVVVGTLPSPMQKGAAQRMHWIPHAVIAPTVSALTGEGDFESQAAESARDDVVGRGAVDHKASRDVGLG
jgi:hypothetical protein